MDGDRRWKDLGRCSCCWLICSVDRCVDAVFFVFVTFRVGRMDVDVDAICFNMKEGKLSVRGIPIGSADLADVSQEGAGCLVGRS